MCSLTCAVTQDKNAPQESSLWGFRERSRLDRTQLPRAWRCSSEHAPCSTCAAVCHAAARRRAFQLPGNGPVGQPLLFQRLNDPSFFSLKVLPAFAFRQFCVIMMAVHSDRPLDKCCLQTLFYHAGISLWIFLLGVQLHYAINQGKTTKSHAKSFFALTKALR